MRGGREFVRLGHVLLIASTAILLLPGRATADLSADALKELAPEGYKIEKTVACEPDRNAPREYLVALSDADEQQLAAKPVMLLLVAAGKSVVVEDRVTLHNSAGTGQFWDGPPNYFEGLTKEKVGAGDLFLISSFLSGGGPGSLHYFDCYGVERKKLRLVKSFSHGRMDRTYFAVYKNAIYDAKCVCARGEKHGKAYVYTCYLDVTKYAFDGRAIQPVGSERMREQHGNRFLQDKYWFISVLKALQTKEIFAQ
jgi:hypothetical protein